MNARLHERGDLSGVGRHPSPKAREEHSECFGQSTVWTWISLRGTATAAYLILLYYWS